MSHHELDARYLLCPMPVIRAQERIARLAPAETLAVRCTDPGALHDIPAWCRIHGHSVIDAHTTGGEVWITVRVGNGEAAE